MRNSVCLSIGILLIAIVASAQIPTIEREALIALYNSSAGENWTDNTNWLGDIGTECTWFGVWCNEGKVTHLYLQENNLTGSLPAELGNFSSLQLMSLFLNQLNGSLPPELGNLSNLSELYLDYNNLSGNIPSEWGNLVSLQLLRLDNNHISGSIPPELGNLSSLQKLYLHDNQLSGRIPSELGNLSNLQYLWLAINQLSGEIPVELMNLSNLISLEICDNSLYTDNAALQAWLDLLQPGWDECQTSGEIFTDGFESGDTSVWSVTSP